MTRPIDEKIVVMKLDNSDFKRKTVETTSLFGKLRDSLTKIPGVNLGKTTQDLSNISKQTDSINMNRLADNVQTVASRFTNLGVVATTVLANLTNRAVNAGLAITKSLTLDQITQGFSEYELKISSIKTILANTEWAGTGLDDVKGALEDLNVYADQTIYNFAQMTANIGRFTAAGVKLDDATIAIKGLSNLAATSGSDVNQLNTAMYQMSQAMAAGRMNLMDWNSLVNAGMGGKMLQDALLETAKGMGKQVDMSEGFRYSIEQGWLTSEVFLETLRKFGKDESMIEAATKVRTFSQLMDTLKESIGSGWAMTFEHIFGDFEEATNLWSKVADTLTGAVGTGAEARNRMLSMVADGGGFQNIFEGIQNATKPVVKLFDIIGHSFRQIFPPTSVGQILKLTETFKEFTAGLSISRETTGQLVTIFKGFFSVFNSIWEIAKRLTNAFVNIIPEDTSGNVLNFLERIAEMALTFNESIKEGNLLTDTIEGLATILGAIVGTVGNIIGVIGSFGGALRDGLGTAIDWVMDKLAPIGQALKETFGDGLGGDELVGAGLIAGIVMVLTQVTGLITQFFDITGGFADTLEGIGDAVQNFVLGIKIANLILIAIALATLAGALKTLEGIKAEDLARGITALAVSLGVMIGGMMLMDKYNVVGGMRVAATLIALAASVSIMASALKKISDLDVDEMKRGIFGLAGITAILATAIITISKYGGKIGAGSLQLLALAGAVVILTSAVEKLSAIDTGSLWKSIGALGVIFAQLAIFLKVVNGTKFGISSALGVVAIAGALHLMVGAIEKIDGIDTDGLIKGLGVIAIILGQIAIFSKLVSGPNLFVASAAMLLMAGAINALVPPIREFAGMSLVELAKGLGTMAVALLAVAGAALLMQGGLAGAAGLLIMATALNLLLIPIKAFSQMTWGELLIGFAGLAGGIALVAGASMLLSPAILPMMGFGAALLIVGAAMLAAGAGIALFGTGMAMLATATLTSIGAIVSSLSLLLQGLAELIPSVVKFVVELGVALIDGIAELVPKLVTTVVDLIIHLLTTIEANLPEFLRLGIGIVIQLMEGIGEYVPKLVDAGIQMITDFINGLSDAVRDNGPALVSVILELLGEVVLLFVDAGIQVIEALFGWLPGVKAITSTIGEAAEEMIRENFGAKEAGEDKGDEFADALSDKEQVALNAGEIIANAAKDGTSVIDMSTVGSDFGLGFAGGISSEQGSVVSAALSLAKAASENIKDWLDIRSPSRVTQELGGHTGQGFADGIDAKEKEVGKAASNVASSASTNFKEEMDRAKYRFQMEEINGDEYVKEIEKIRDSYSNYSDLAKEANSEIKEAEKDLAGHREKLRKEEFKYSKSWIDERKYYNEMSLKEELSSWQRVMNRYKEGTEERKQAEREVYRVKEELRKAEMTNSKRWIDERQYYNEMSLLEELRAWERVMNRYKEGTEERKEAEREVYRVKNEINRKILDINEDYTSKIEAANQRLLESERSLNEEYERTLDNRISALTGFAGIFDEVTKDSEVSGNDLINNLRSQVDTFSEWANNIQSLAGKGVDEGLIAELREMGPRAADEIAALNTLTEGQLENYVSLWKTKNNLARTQAVKELEGLRSDIDSEIEELRSQTATQLDGYKTEWVESIREIRTGTSDEFVQLETSLYQIGIDSMEGLRDGLLSMEGDVLAEARRMAIEIRGAIADALQIKSPSRVMMRLGEYTGEGLAVGIANTAKQVGSKAKDLALTAKDSLNRFIEGFDLPEGDNELHFKAVIDYDKLDPSKLGNIKAMDTTTTSRLATAIRSRTRQNDNNIARNNEGGSRSDGSSTNDTPKQPIIIQSILNGRVIAEETFNDTNQLFNNQTNLDYVMKGV